MNPAKPSLFRGRMEFHVAARMRDFFGFDLGLFSSSGSVVFADFASARRFAAAMQAKGRTVSVGQVAAMGLVDEMMHYVLEQYRTSQNPNVMREALQRLETSFGPDLDKALISFAQEFPAIKVYRGEQRLEDYLAGLSDDGRPNREIVLEEMLMLWMANTNPAFAPFLELFDDANLEQYTAYLPIIGGLETFFDEQPAFSETGLSLFKSLRLPIELFSDSLEAQLQYLLKRFGGTLGRFMQRLLVSLDVIREESRRFDVAVTIGNDGGGVGAAAFDFKNQQASLYVYEPENFTPDLEWMPNCVLLAKNAFVWLDQLSKKYGKEIRTLDQIPDAELDELRRWGVTGLWLIGLWERSTASKVIKQRMGNTDAVASAYSLYDYEVAADLGGTDAVEVLRQKAWARGIRLASDMVPNHVGVDGRWVVEHPDWFITLPYPPYPAYTFSGPDLSSDDRVGIFLEDHYYDKTDAAVVFKRVDKWTGSETYIYHGNDGTAMPWNDTAQLNYLKAEVREAVIQTILHVARQFPIIRFDAAMTLAKRHIQRLWFPPPGGSSWGNSIPSRAEHALTQEQFDALIPQEFWREVVDRCAVEAPNTLLLAEAFWMMEGYFVRSLGMHRVYNSAFMVMLRDERNAEYRSVLKNTVEFEPEILKRYVNFLNNPDEKTAEKQFGKGEKYFGVMTLCATLPGLPMLGHGQVEGFTEQYGMEYRRAYYDETPDQGLVDHHHQQIFPLLKKRHLFAGSENFVLYDVYDLEGQVEESVFAFSNRTEEKGASERALIVYNNSAGHARGWIALSVAQPVRVGEGRELRQRRLGEGLGLSFDDRTWAVFRDQVTGLEYIRNARELHEKGLFIDLGEYKRMVLLDWREVYDFDGTYARTAHMLGGSGSPNIEDARRQLWLEPVLTPFRELVNPTLFSRLMEAGTARSKADSALLDEVESRYARLAAAVQSFNNSTHSPDLKQFRRKLEKTLQLPALVDGLEPRPRKGNKAVGDDYLRSRATGHVGIWGVALGWLFTHELGGSPEQSAAQMDEMLFGRVLAETAVGMELDEATARRSSELVRLLNSQQAKLSEPAPVGKGINQLLASWQQDAEVQRYLRVNRYDGVVYFNKEAFEALLSSFVRLSAVSSHSRQTKLEAARNTTRWYGVLSAYRLEARRAGYRFEELLGKKPRAARTSNPKPPAKKKAPKAEAAKATPKSPRKTKALVEAPKVPAKPVPKPRKAPAKPAPKVPDDLSVIEGIGPKMAAALTAAGLLTYEQLAGASQQTLRDAIGAAGLRFAPSLPTWAEQAGFLARGDRAGFEAFIKELVAGRVRK